MSWSCPTCGHIWKKRRVIRHEDEEGGASLGQGITQAGPMTFDPTHYYRVRRWLPERYATRCEVLIRAKGPGPKNVLIRFADGARYVVPRRNIRRWQG